MKKLVKESLNESDLDKILKSIPKPDKYDDSMFCMSTPDGSEVAAMGDEFNPDAYDMTLEDMLEHIDAGIQEILESPKTELSYEDLGDYADFFETEFNDDDGEGLPDSLSKEYIIAKLICGKENAKSF
jgi:hypothetical protein